MSNKLDITSKEISSLKEMDLLFENYCKKSGITLDFSKSNKYNAYIVAETANAYVWFIRGTFNAIGDEHLKSLLTEGN